MRSLRKCTVFELMVLCVACAECTSVHAGLHIAQHVRRARAVIAPLIGPHPYIACYTVRTVSGPIYIELIINCIYICIAIEAIEAIE
jgi:hypothetical protein